MPEEWPQWIKRFERFLQASGIMTNSEESQVNTLIYSMGQKADDILQSFGLSEEEEKKYKTMKDKFDGYFIQCRNPIFEHAKFNIQKPEKNKLVENFIIDLYNLAKHCGYNSLHDKMISDRIIMRIRDRAVSEKMQMESTLTLKKAISLARRSKSVKTQQPTIRSELPQETVVEAVKDTKVSSNRKNGPSNTKCSYKSTRCERCGKPGFHSRAQCPA